MRKILFIDDEANILRSLKRLFRNLEYECYYADGINEAIKIYLSLDFIDMLVTDIKMPNFDGIRLLKVFKEASPRTIRVALSGYASVDSITEAVSKNLAKQYFYKPWNNDEIISSIRKMFSLEDEFEQVDLFDKVQNFENVKTLPRLFDRINMLIQKDKSIEEICVIIEEDLAITSNILRLANSAFYQAKTGNLQQAVMYIGLNNLKQIILSYEISQMKEALIKSGESIWKHAARTNNIFYDLYEKYYKKKVPSIVGTAGLIHDIGKIIMLQIFENAYSTEVLQQDISDGQITVLERSLFKIDHAVVGGYFLNWWAFPMELIEVCMYHHRPLDEHIIHKELVAIVTLSTFIEKKEYEILGSSFLGALDILKIDLDYLKPIIEKYENE
ncbi:HDOD domain-containing protein [Fusibacter ferrireducens]|uniref:Stage 0 sporulation protein A homolog n=1 Tax=Fusibacter ferrireducens TaxID=2785058 RepID=A0ABR9ZU90_9FIRM|nr:HDOD domain-containing protein [Fusibacter ferrireducens]MBF4693723.1 HDOD domain-containing protein [Fusibacter ferrireducens]